MELPEGWEWKKIGAISEVTSGGGAPQDKEYFTEKGSPFIRAGSLERLLSKSEEESLEKLSSEAAKSHKLRLFPTEAIIFAKSGMSATKNRVYMLRNDCFVVNHLAVLIPTVEIDPRFLKYCIFWYNPTNLIRDKAYPSIRLSDISSLKIPLPPLPVQKKIVAILDRADRTRRLHQELERHFDEFLKSVFIGMFGDPVTNPKGWEVKKLEVISEIRSGVTKGRKLKKENIIKLPYLRVANVQDGYLNLSEIKYIDAVPSDLEKYRLEYGDVLLTEGGDFDKLGRGGFWKEEVANCIHQNHIFRVRCKTEFCYPRYFSHTLQTQYSKKYFLRASKKTSNLATINMKQLKAFSLPLPPLPLQQKFASIVENVEELRQQHQRSMRESNDLFDALMQKAFRGELT